MNADLELQIALVGRILHKRPEEVVEEAVRLFCRSIAGAKDHHGRPAKAIDTALLTTAAREAAKRATDAPGSVEARIVAFVKKHQTVRPSAIAAAVKVDRSTTQRAVRLLTAAGVLRVSGATVSRRVSLA